MAEDVCECWEDLEKSEVLDKKLQQLGLKGESSDSSSAATLHDAAATSRLLDHRSPGSVTVLRRPTSESTTCKKQEDEYGTRLNANSQPFVPRSQVPAIQMEDSTRTQFKPKLMILKRETKGSGKGASDATAGGARAGAGPTSRTFEEREAQYLKARERIMGSATASPAEPSAPPAARPVTSGLRPQGQAEVPLLRQPQGPSADGERGFQRSKR